MLGQGELLRLETIEGFDPLVVLKTLAPKSRLHRENSCDKNQKPGSLFARRQKGAGKMKYLILLNNELYCSSVYYKYNFNHLCFISGGSCPKVA